MDTSTDQHLEALFVPENENSEQNQEINQERERKTIKGFSPKQQNSNIPVGWKPTYDKPEPVVRCKYIFPSSHDRAGEQCGKWSLRYSPQGKCRVHSGNGNFPNVTQWIEQTREAAKLEFLDKAEKVQDRIYELAMSSESDAVSLSAAKDWLDRAGIKSDTQINVTVETKEDPATALGQRLLQISKRNSHEENTAELEVIDAEVIENESDHS